MLLLYLRYTGFATGGAASVLNGWGSNAGTPTGFASSVGGLADITSAAAYGIGTGTGLGKIASNIVMPFASCISGFGGILTAVSPLFRCLWCRNYCFG